MPNERLRSAIAAARVTVEEVAASVEVDPKTVQRWLSGRRPYHRHQWAVAQFLDEDPDYLWPRDGADPASGDAVTHEVVAVYAHRAAMPVRTWWRLLTEANSQIDLLGYAMLHLPEQHPELMDLLRRKSAEGCKVRIALADPTSPSARERDREERLNEGLLARIRTSTMYFGELLDAPGVELRQHATPLYNSIFRFDDHMFVTPHLHGTPGARAPLLHLRRRDATGVFDQFLGHFDSIWATTTPIGGT